jgi:hypothetical protein
LEKDEMPGTADRQEFGQSLNDSKENGLEDAHRHSVLINSKRFSGYLEVGIRVSGFKSYPLSDDLITYLFYFRKLATAF